MIRISCSLFLAASLWSAPADLVITARYVVTMDATHRVIENGAVAVAGGRIAAVGARSDILSAWQPATRIDRPAGLVAPGLINTHTHAAMSLLRGIADDLSLQEWLTKYIFPAEARNVTPEFVRAGTRLAVLEMLLGGTTTYTDMYYFEELVAEETKAAGMRAVLGQTIIGFPVPDAKTPQEGLARAERFLRQFNHDALITPAVAPHAVYTNTDETLQACRALANRYGKPMVIHLSETKRENEDLLAKRGLTPTGLLEQLGALSGRTVAAHCIWVDEADIGILTRRRTGIAHCPSSNMKLASGVAPVGKMIAAGLAVGLGPDGPAGSNNDFNLFEEIDLAAKLQKVWTMDPRALAAEQAFAMATIEGARALGMEKQIGSIETGKLADLITVDLSQPHAVPLFNVYSHLAYALKASDVLDVIVNGRVVVRSRNCLTLRKTDVLAAAALFTERIRASMKAAH